MTVLDLLVEKLPTAKRTTLRRLLEAGRVRVDGAIVRRLSQPVGESAKCEIAPASPAIVRRLDPGFRTVYEDADLLVVDKPAGLITQSGPRDRRKTLVEMVRADLASRDPRAMLGLIHRLDRDASGLLVLTKNPVAYRSLKSQLRRRTIGREYLAVVRPAPSPDRGQIRSNLVERADGTVHSVRSPSGMNAVTDYVTVSAKNGQALLRIRLHTGRKHQIRVHLSERGYPIVGDTVYGGAPAPRLLLAAVNLEFIHPRTGKPVVFSIEPPSELIEYLQRDPPPTPER